MPNNKYTVHWEKRKDNDFNHTASTLYVTDGFKIWKGKRRIFSIIYSANEWHLIRTRDQHEIHSGKTAKECMGVLEYCIKRNDDINHFDNAGICEGVKFNEDFTDYFID